MAARQEFGNEAAVGQSAPRATPAIPPAGSFTLQRSAGDAAVTAWLQRSGMAAPPRTAPVRDKHEHAPGCGQHALIAVTGTTPPKTFAPSPAGPGTSVHVGTGALGAAGIAALQRSVGNAAVSKIVSRAVGGTSQVEEDVQGHEQTHEPQVQRTAVRGVLRSPGRPMDPALRGEMEQPTEATARRVMRSAFSPAPSHGSENPGLPQHTEGGNGSVSAGLSVQRALIVGDTNYTAVYKRDTERLPDPEKRQVLLKMMNRVNLRFNLVRERQEFTPQEVQEFDGEHDRIQFQLAKAIVDPVGEIGYHPVLKKLVGKNKDFGAKNQDIRVDDYDELARHLMGWVYAKDNRHKEKIHAESVYRDDNIDLYLNVVLKRLYGYMQHIVPHIKRMDDASDDRNVKLMYEELTRGIAHIKSQPIMANGQHNPKGAGKPVGLYIAHFDGEFRPKLRGTHLDARIVERGGLLEVMRNPQGYNLREKIICLHDLSEYFGPSKYTPPTQGKYAFGQVTGSEAATTTGWNPRDGRTTTRDRGRNPEFPSTRNENSDTTRFARQKRVPVWSGQSHTAGRMFKMAKEAGASTEEIAAIGWGIFAFWRTDFDHTSKFAPHTLHEVMDIAQNFGVDYDINNPYGSYSMLDLKRTFSEVETITRKIDALHSEAAESATWMREQVLKRGMTGDPESKEIIAGLDSVSEKSENLGYMIKSYSVYLDRWESLSPKERVTAFRTIVDMRPGWTRDIADIQQLIARANRH